MAVVTPSLFVMGHTAGEGAEVAAQGDKRGCTSVPPGLQVAPSPSEVRPYGPIQVSRLRDLHPIFLFQVCLDVGYRT